MDIIIVYDNIKDRKFFDLHEFKIPFNLEYINDKRVSINYQEELKYTKSVRENDVIIIRGKGKFII